jgi:hypothetical protein
MFTNLARTAVWGSSWFFNPETETNPLMAVTLELAAVDTHSLNVCPYAMDAKIFKGVIWGVTEQQQLTNLQQCLRDLNEVKKYVKDGIKLIAKLDSWDVSEGFKEIF